MRRAFHTALGFVALWFGLGLLGLACLLWSAVYWSMRLVRRRSPGGRLGRYVAMAWFRVYLWILQSCGALKLDVAGLDALRDEGPLIIAPNHPSLLDALLVISRLPNVVCVMKNDLFSSWVFGGGARFAGHIGNDSVTAMVRESVDALRAGNTLLLFPEGPRTVRDPVNRLTDAVGLIAHRANVPVQTVLIEADSKFLGKGWSLRKIPALPARFRVRLGKRYAPPADVRSFTREMERYFIDQLGASPAATANAETMGNDRLGSRRSVA